MKHYGLSIAEGSEITNLTVATGTSFPGNESVGELFFRTDQQTLYVWDGSEWDNAGGAGLTEVVEDTTPELGGDLDTNGNKIVGSSNVWIAANDGATGAPVIIEAGDGTGGLGGIIRLRPGKSDSSASADVEIAAPSASTDAPRLRFSEAGTNGVNTINLQAPTAVASDRTWTLPEDDPSTADGKFLTTDSSGNLSFAETGIAAAQPILYEYTATAGQTTFSGSDDNGATLSYVAGSLLVFKNGSLLDPDDYTATNGTSVVLDTAAALNDEVNIQTYKGVDSFNTIRTYRYLMDTGDDTASGTDAKGNTLGYAINLLNVYLNGSKLSEDEYTATDGSSVVLDDALTSDNNILEITTYSTFTSVDEIVARENLIINGNFNVWQRETTFTRTGVGSGTYTADRWEIFAYGAMTLGIDQDGVDRPSGSDYSLAINVDVVDTSIGAADWAYARYKIEGFDLQSTKISTADAEIATLSFKVKSPLTGTHCVSFRNGTLDRYYISEYTIDTADTWETKTITLPLDTTGTWDLGSGAGMVITWALAIGSDNHGTAGSWQAGNKLATSNQVNVVGTQDDKFKLSQVRFELGSQASAFRDRQIEQELALCQRYYCKSYDLADAPTTATENGSVGNRATSSGWWGAPVPFPVRMRAVPTMVMYNPGTGTTGQIRYGSGTTYNDTGEFWTIGEGAAFARATNASASYANALGRIHYTADAEL